MFYRERTHKWKSSEIKNEIRHQCANVDKYQSYQVTSTLFSHFSIMLYSGVLRKKQLTHHSIELCKQMKK